MKHLGHLFTAALLATAAALPACAYDASEQVGTAEEAVGGTGSNNVSPQAVDSLSLSRGVTNSFGITSPSAPDAIQLCVASTVTSSGCTMRPEWESWLDADQADRGWAMKGIAKCSVEPGFTIQTSDGSMAFPGQWPLYPGWKTNRLPGQEAHERVSACILTLLNGDNESYALCIIGPGGSPFSDACSDSSMTVREGGYFGDLFAATPTAYVAGPDSAPADIDGRACYATQGTYCCAEDDTTCSHHIVLAGSITGTAGDDYADKRCNGLATSGSYQYCTQFFSTREPGRVYNNVFTTFIPVAP